MPFKRFSDLVDTMRGFGESRVLLAAVELDVFTAVGEGASAAQVAARVGADPRATEMLLNAIVSLGALAKRNGVFHNTRETARYLVAGSPDCQRLALMHSVNVWKSWTTLTECVRAGSAVLPARLDGQDAGWTSSFIAAMHRNAATTAAGVVGAVGAAGVRRLLDVGGGSGAYSIAFARTNPGLEAVVFDLEAVLPIARGHIEEAGLGGRITTRAGDLRRDQLGSGFDLVLLSAICHMLGPAENRDLLGRCGRALASGGRIVIRDFILDPDKAGPRSATLFALNMLVATPGGSTYTLDEYTDWLEAAGFVDVERLDPPGDLIAARRP